MQSIARLTTELAPRQAMHDSPDFNQIVRGVMHALVRGDANVQGHLRRTVTALVVAERYQGAKRLGVGLALQAYEPRSGNWVGRHDWIECDDVTRRRGQ